MKYEKPPLKISDQAQRLLDRGLNCQDRDRMEKYLIQIGYYRLSAYFPPFYTQSQADQNDHLFRQGTDFQDILSIYIFDRKLRLFVMEAIERIEVSVRSHWSNALAMTYGSHAIMDAQLYDCPWKHTKYIAQIANNLSDSREVFIEHYKSKYSDPFLPPIWAVVETFSLGQLSKWIESTKDAKIKKEIAKQLGLPQVEILQNSLHCLTNIRNICAHHGRLWNKRNVIQIRYIKKLSNVLTIEETVTTDGIQKQPSRQIYNYLVLISHIIKNINPQTSWTKNLILHIDTATSDQIDAMGFPTNWKQNPFWR